MQLEHLPAIILSLNIYWFSAEDHATMSSTSSCLVVFCLSSLSLLFFCSRTATTDLDSVCTNYSLTYLYAIARSLVNICHQWRDTLSYWAAVLVRALQACIMGPPDDWRRRIGRPRQSWLRTTVEADLRPMNLGLATSKRRAQVRSTWRKATVTTSTTSSRRRRRSLYGSRLYLNMSSSTWIYLLTCLFTGILLFENNNNNW